jgi:hypothetical protein
MLDTGSQCFALIWRETLLECVECYAITSIANCMDVELPAVLSAEFCKD